MKRAHKTLIWQFWKHYWEVRTDLSSKSYVIDIFSHFLDQADDVGLIVWVLCHLTELLSTVIGIAGPSEAGGAGGFSPPNNLLKFVDFVSEKVCKSQRRKNEDSNSYIFEESTIIYPKCNISWCHTSQKFHNLHGKTLISRDPLPPSITNFPKMGRFPTM